MSYYERPSPEEYEDIIDDLEDQIEDLKKERENILSDIEFMEKESKVHCQSIIDLKFEIDKLISENKELKEQLERISDVDPTMLILNQK
mgnify:CR=1 FL=1|tara:strand:+ start:381 stop:647 length:267 start_codon:yes stop_codon:yes gene_type:complete